MDELTRRDEALLRMEANIHRHGWTSYYVIDQASWLYTIGICESFDQPELIVFGLDQQSAYEAAFGYVERVRSGKPIETGRAHRHDLAGRSVVLLDVKPEFVSRSHDYFLGWIDYYEAVRKDLTGAARQLVWSAEGRFPWEPGFPAILSDRQPLLDSPAT